MTTVPYDPDLDPILLALEQRCKDATAAVSAALTAQISTLSGDLGATKAENAALKARVAKAEADVGALLQRVAALEEGAPPDPTLPALDPTGTTIPVTDYEIPAGAIFVSPAGNNANPGTEAAPKRTVFGTGGAFAALPPSGGTIVLRGGTYEEGTTTGGHWLGDAKPCTIQAYPGEQAWFDGSAVVTGWRGNGPWTVSGWTFDAGNTSGFATDKPSTTFYFDQLFIDGVPQKRVTGTAPKAGEFSVVSGTIYVGSSPLSKQVRVSRYRGLFVASAKANLLGIGVRRFANGVGNSTGGFSGVYYGGNSAGTIIENCVFADHACNPVSINKTDFVVNRCVFARSAKTHLNAGGSTGCDRLKVTGCVGYQSNLGGWPPEPTAGAIKIVKGDQVEVTDCVIEDAPGAYLLWFDQTCTRAKIARNTLISTPGRESKTGLLWEISGGGLLPATGTRTQHWSYIVGNKIEGSCTYGGLVLLDSDFTKVWCNEIEAGRDSVVMIRQDNRPTGLAETAAGTYNYGAVTFLSGGSGGAVGAMGNGRSIEFCNNDIGPASRYGQFIAYNSNGIHPPSANTMFSKLSGNWWKTGNTNGAVAVQWGETNQDGSRVSYNLIPTSAGPGALDSRSSFAANGWRNFQGATPPATIAREPIPADVASLLVATGA